MNRPETLAAVMGPPSWEAEDLRVLRRDPNDAIVRERQRRAWLRYGEEG
jgi:hypothetical protein